jgi:hypothetical protein
MRLRTALAPQRQAIGVDRKNDTNLRPAGQHPRIGGGRLFERIGCPPRVSAPNKGSGYVSGVGQSAQMS